ncbi:MAG: hypothetical protein IH624_07285 [Phycisphaerae bacterium]|nr:hypothetical protein [Phycisphaerae bacterium]
MLCLAYRWKISNTFDSNLELSARCRRHLMRCDACRSFFRSSLALGERLSLEAALAQPSVPARLGGEVTALISRSAGVGNRVQTSHRRAAAAAACAAAVLMPVVFAAVGYFRADRTPPSAGPEPVAVQAFGTDTAPLATFAQSVGRLLERPLAAEVEALQRQGKSAIEFLLVCTGADLTIRREPL